MAWSIGRPPGLLPRQGQHAPPVWLQHHCRLADVQRLMASQPFCRRKGACLLLAERSIRQACCSIVLHGRPCHLCCTICKAGAACVAHCRQKASLKSRHSRAAMPLTVQGWWRSWPGTGPVSTESPPAAALSATAAARAAAAAAGGRVPPPCRPAAAPAAGRQQWTGQWAATLPPPTAAGVAVGNVLPGVNINLAVQFLLVPHAS